jgi:myo-inositol 2-dehydrogenase / D-chiro-inositol 1-dehydrogenase
VAIEALQLAEAGSMVDTVGVGLIGAGRMGSFHAETVHTRVSGADLASVADPAPDAARRITEQLSGQAFTDPQQLIDDPRVDAVIIATPARTHAALVVACAEAGKAVFCEKPMALTLTEADAAVAAAEHARIPLQVGFNRRFAADFAAAREVIAAGGIGTPQLLRSVIRDPGLADPGAVRPWTIFLETLIHDLDALLWLNTGARPLDVYAVADALVAPEFRDTGLLDTAVVVVRFDNGAIATAEASFSAAYGYDIRAEVFGSAGMVTAGTTRETAMQHWTADGVHARTVRRDTELFASAYTAELTHFVDCVRTDTTPQVSGHDARRALALALACIRSVQEGRPVRLEEVEP